MSCQILNYFLHKVDKRYHELSCLIDVNSRPEGFGGSEIFKYFA